MNCATVSNLKRYSTALLQSRWRKPRGPVYLTLPREVLAEPCEAFALQSSARANPPTLAHPEPEGVREAAAILAAARNPLMITSSAGQRPEVVAELIKLAETGGIPGWSANRTLAESSGNANWQASTT